MSFTVTTVNVNGIKAATTKLADRNMGFNQWLAASSSDVVLLQEVRAQEKAAREYLAPVLDLGWHFYSAESEFKGRAGVAILSKHPLTEVSVGIPDFENAGRFIEGGIGNTRFASLYLPSGAADTDKQDEKYRFLDVFEEVLADRAQRYKRMVIGGDWNIAHRQQDIKNWKTNRKKSGFLPDERAFMDSVFGTFPDEESQVEGSGDWAGAVEYSNSTGRRSAEQPSWFDVARRLAPEESGPYTWWTYRYSRKADPFANDAGWRIDYQAVTAELIQQAEESWVDKAPDRTQRWSDHAPLNVRYSGDLTGQ